MMEECCPLGGGCSETAENPYRRFQYRKLVLIAAVAVSCMAVSVISLRLGDYTMTSKEVLKAIFGFGDRVSSVVIWRIRLPRILAAVLIGTALAIAGTVMQCVLKNPLASPYTLGISSAAAFGASLAIAASHLGFFAGNFIGDVLSGMYGTSIFAFMFSMISVAIVVFFSRTSVSTAESMVLAGIAIGSIFGAALSSLQYFVDDAILASIVYWQFGDLTKATWNELTFLAVVLVPIIGYFVYHRLDYNSMEAGEEVAMSLGIDTKKLTIVSMVLASGVAALCVSMVGIIGFVGLLGPHIMRRLIGGDHRFLIPAAVVMGVLVLLVSDFAGRAFFTHAIPVGIVTSFLGGPLFLYILIKRNRRC